MHICTRLYLSGIRQLQLILLKVCLLLGVEVQTGVEFKGFVEPSGATGTSRGIKYKIFPW